ncbi:hypothetical protein ACH5RR_038657 [Cinchona calisaya]|uniref:CBF1-interacting co-repressor CIR N-terminal domain-containing protein n=1 Tax=Cinchona calisaya TaxID=153742 RepID=A0ABD2Y1I5_9GENT
MGGHGGLNILPQKRWNVYNYENREKVRRDEEAAAKEEQLQREQSRKRDAEFRLEQLRKARGLSKTSTSASTPEVVAEADEKPASVELKSESDSKHMNLFEGIRIFDPIDEGREVRRDEKKEKNKRVKKEEAVRVVTAEDEKYRLGYGVAGKGVKLPWYMEKPSGDFADQKKGADEDDDHVSGGGDREGGKKKRKSLEELREERLKRERKEKERERALLSEKSRRDGGFSLRR